MKVKVSDPAVLGDLIAFLARAEYLVQQVDEGALLVSPRPRSYSAERVRLDLDLHLRAWEAAHEGVHSRITHDAREHGT